MSNDEAADEPDESAEAETAEPDGLQAGDFVEIAYTARTVDGGQLVDTTDADVAEEEGVGEDQEFGPRTIVLGEGHIFEPIEDDIIGRDVGETGTVVVPPAESFGEYDDEQVRTVSKDKIPEDDRYPGAQVSIDGQQGFVETIVGGRARVDFNHPLAGEDVEYEYEILDVIEDRNEQASGLLSMFLDLELDVWFQTDTVEEEQLVESDDGDEGDGEDESDADAGEEATTEPEYETVEVEKESLYVEAVPALTMNQQWMMQKQQIAQQLIELLGVDRVVIQETIDGSGMGMPGMMGGMGGGGIEDALAEADIDADDLDDIDELADELEGE